MLVLELEVTVRVRIRVFMVRFRDDQCTKRPGTRRLAYKMSGSRTFPWLLKRIILANPTPNPNRNPNHSAKVISLASYNVEAVAASGGYQR